MTLSPQLVLTIVAVGTALLRFIPRLEPLVPQKWRTIPAITCAFVGMVVGVAQAGTDAGLITTAVMVGIVAIAGIFSPGALPPGAVAEPGKSLVAATKEITTLRAASKAGES